MPERAPEQAASAEIDDAVAQALGALLADRDVSEIAALEGGFLEVVRRGRREKLDAILEGPLFALLREAGADRDLLSLRLRAGERLRAGPLADERTALRIEKAPPLDATLERLVEEGVLPPGIPEELVAAVLEGAGVLVLGSSRVARQRVVAGVVRALQGKVAWFGASDALSALVPVPLARGAALAERARAAVSFGADALCALEVTPAELRALAEASLGLPLVCSVTASSMDALQASLGVPVAAAGGTSAVVGHGPDGRPRLVELHGPSRAVSPAEPAPSAPPAPGVRPLAPAEVSGLSRRPDLSSAVVSGEEPLPPLAELPEGWASDAPDDDPGWELGSPPPAGEAMTPSVPVRAGANGAPAKGSFDAALAAQKARPSFAPRPPPAHPQTAALRGDPFGGLTFEPPPGGPEPAGDDEARAAGPGGDDGDDGDDGDEE